MLNVDLGYLTFKMAFGNYDMWQVQHGTKVGIAAVDNRPKRKEVYPAYKEQRNSKSDPAVIDAVWALRRQIEEERVLPLCSIEGLEADDIVACWQLFNPYDKIVGVDKDFFQLPNVENLYYHNLKPYNYLNTLAKLPQYVQPLAANNFALYQMLLGDVADNIPRLLSKGKEGKQQLEFIYTAIKDNHLMDSLLDLFGEAIITNAKLVLLPYYEWFDGGSSDWFKMWCLGHYHNPFLWSALYEKINSCKLQNTVKEDNTVYEMFSLI